MKKLASLRNPVVRLGFGVVLAIAILLGASYLRSQNHTSVDEYAEQIGSLVGSLESAQAVLGTLPDPSSLTLQKKGAVREYANQIDAVTSRLKTDYPKLHPPVRTPIKDSRVSKFNEIVTSHEFALSLRVSTEAMKEAITLLKYQASGIRTLANMLEYDPVLDTSADNTELIGSLGAAGEGLIKLTQGLDKLTGTKDVYKKDVYTQIKNVDRSRQAYLTALMEGRPTEDLKQSYINTVREAQKTIKANRQEFWMEKNAEILPNLEKQASTLRPFSRQLYK